LNFFANSEAYFRAAQAFSEKSVGINMEFFIEFKNLVNSNITKRSP